MCGASPSPACLAPQLLRTNTGFCPEDDPRRVAAREAHDAYARSAPPGMTLDRLERRVAEGAVSSIRQEALGVYSFVKIDLLGSTVDRIGGPR